MSCVVTVYRLKYLFDWVVRSVITGKGTFSKVMMRLLDTLPLVLMSFTMAMKKVSNDVMFG